jgi:protein-S-isoprenylcysteine O-methyltransferase Ste14
MDSVRKILLIIPSSVIFFLLVPVFSVFFGKTLDTFLGLSPLSFGIVTSPISIVLLLVGGYYVIESIRILLAKGKGIPLGDIFPKDQTTELITTGIYAQTRNPMIFGYFLCLIAVGLVLKSPSIAFLIPTGFIGIWNIWLKTREEPALEARFGDSYRKYKKKTPYLIPRSWRK